MHSRASSCPHTNEKANYFPKLIKKSNNNPRRNPQTNNEIEIFRLIMKELINKVKKFAKINKNIFLRFYGTRKKIT